MNNFIFLCNHIDLKINNTLSINMTDLERLSRQIQSMKLTTPIRVSSHCRLHNGDVIGGYEVSKVLGTGRFSTVWLAKKPTATVAIKVYRMGGTNAKYYANEVKILNRIFQHSMQYGTTPPNLIGYLGTFAHVDIGCDLAPIIHPCIIFNLAGESVSKLLRYSRQENKAGLPLQLVKKITKDILHALVYLHSCNIIHTDIKPSNLLMNMRVDDIHDGNIGSFEISVGDLGGSTFCDDLFSLHVGTAQYCAPELLLELNYGTSIDIWAVFTTVYELITTMLLFDIYNECAIDYGDDEIEQMDDEIEQIDDSEYMDVDIHNECKDIGKDKDKDKDKYIDRDIDIDIGNNNTYDDSVISSHSDSSDDDDDCQRVNYQHLLLMEKILGSPPKHFTRNGRVYYNARGKLKNNPNVTVVPIWKLLILNCHIDVDECKRIEEFLLGGLKYNSDERITAEQALKHPWLQ